MVDAEWEKVREEWGLCEANDCDGGAFVRYRWPGRDWMRACLVHTAEAINVAGVMGFVLQVEKLDPKPKWMTIQGEKPKREGFAAARARAVAEEIK